jgi:hypothetical protein
MRQNLSYTAIAATLAALATAACGGSQEPAESPVGGKEVPAASSETPAEAAATDEKTTETSEAAGSDTATPGAVEDKPAEAAPATTSTAAPAPAPAKKPSATKKTGGAKMSCGAGTCG